MVDATPRIEPSASDQGGAVRLLGEWTARQFGRPQLVKELRRALPAAGAA